MSRNDIYALLSVANAVYNEDLTAGSPVNSSQRNQSYMNGYIINNFDNPFFTGNTREKRVDTDNGNRRDHNPVLTNQEAFNGIN